MTKKIKEENIQIEKEMYLPFMKIYLDGIQQILNDYRSYQAKPLDFSNHKMAIYESHRNYLCIVLKQQFELYSQNDDPIISTLGEWVEKIDQVFSNDTNDNETKKAKDLETIYQYCEFDYEEYSKQLRN